MNVWSPNCCWSQKHTCEESPGELRDTKLVVMLVDVDVSTRLY